MTARTIDPSQTQTLAALALVIGDLQLGADDRDLEIKALESSLQEERGRVDELTRERDALLDEIATLKREREVAAVPDPPVEFDGLVPVLAGVGVSVAGVVATFRAGHSMAEVARLFSVSEAHVEAAIRWHVQQGKKRRRR